MRSILICIAALLYACSTYAQATVTINGSVTGLKQGTKVTVRPGTNPSLIDSAFAEEGTFTLKNVKAEGEIFLLQIGTGQEAQNTMLYLAPGKVNIRGARTDLKDAQYSGSPYIVDFGRFNTKMKSYPQFDSLQKLDDLYVQALRTRDTPLYKSVIDDLLRLGKICDSIRTGIAKEWVAANPASDINPMILYMHLSGKLTDEQMQQHLGALSPAAKSTFLAQALQRSIAANKTIKIGSEAPVFTQRDVAGKPVSLSDFRGRYVLLDFWASWCGPCRAENPNLVKAFEKYKDKNFTILAVSLDENKEKWEAAIKKDGLTWTHVSDLRYWRNEAALQYDVKYVPANFLIGPDGKILAKNIKGKELDARLQAILP